MTTPSAGERDQCRATVTAIETRIAALSLEKTVVEENRRKLPPDYDKASIDATLEQIQSEIDTRRAALPGMKARCADLADRT